ncbi:MAG: helix-turn-helix domain-containing protein [Chitinophagaceae bacterium]
MNPSNVQLLFFQHLKTQLPPHLSMVDEIAELLGISTDSAYRRIRGEKPIDLEETHKLCSHYKISIDHLLNLQSDAFIFRGSLPGNNADVNFENWLQTLQDNLHYMNSFGKRHMYYLMKDIPPFVHFLVPELSAFKCFFWMKSILHNERLKGVKFTFQDQRYEKFTGYSKKIIEEYLLLPSTEIWNVESLNSTLNQINFYAEAGSFSNKADIRTLYEKVEEMINHLEKQAELGVKFTLGGKPAPNAASYRMFVNELILGDNTIMAELDDTRITFLNHSVLNIVTTRDERFNKSMFASVENLMKKSAMISVIGEKERVSFFNRLRNNIQLRLSALS